jgi:hypothetical protein
VIIAIRKTCHGDTEKIGKTKAKSKTLKHRGTEAAEDFFLRVIRGEIFGYAFADH